MVVKQKSIELMNAEETSTLVKSSPFIVKQSDVDGRVTLVILPPPITPHAIHAIATMAAYSASAHAEEGGDPIADGFLAGVVDTEMDYMADEWLVTQYGRTIAPDADREIIRAVLFEEAKKCFLDGDLW